MSHDSFERLLDQIKDNTIFYNNAHVQQTPPRYQLAVFFISSVLRGRVVRNCIPLRQSESGEEQYETSLNGFSMLSFVYASSISSGLHHKKRRR